MRSSCNVAEHNASYFFVFTLVLNAVCLQLPPPPASTTYGFGGLLSSPKSINDFNHILIVYLGLNIHPFFVTLSKSLGRKQLFCNKCRLLNEVQD